MKKKLLCLFILAIGICSQIALQANAQTQSNTISGTQSDIEEIIQLNLEVKNKKIVPYLEKAFYYSKTDDEAISYYEQAIKELKNIKTPEKSDIETIAAIYILIGDLKLKQNKIQAAFSCYALGYNILKNNNLKNSKFVFPCLFKTYELAKKENNERYYKDSMFLIVSTQSETAEKYPSIYSIFSEYYKSIGNGELEKYYKEKSKTKTHAVITFGNNNILKDEKIIVADEEGAKYIEKALNTENSSEEQSKCLKEAINYYKNKVNGKKKKDYNDGKVLISLVILAANNEKNIINFERAMKLYKWAYDFMKMNKVQENSPLALYCLYNMYFISQIFEDKKFCDYSITEIEKYELGLNNKEIYHELSTYYEEKGNNKKAEFYLNLEKK